MLQLQVCGFALVRNVNRNTLEHLNCEQAKHIFDLRLERA